MKPNQTAKQAAASVAHKVADENLEFLKSAKNQVLPTPELVPLEQQVVQEVSEPQVDPQLKAKIDADSKKQMDKLEAELKQIRTEREEQIAKNRKEQPHSVEASQGSEVTNPPGKMRKAIDGMKKRLTGKREMDKHVSG